MRNRPLLVIAGLVVAGAAACAAQTHPPGGGAPEDPGSTDTGGAAPMTGGRGGSGPMASGGTGGQEVVTPTGGSGTGGDERIDAASTGGSGAGGATGGAGGGTGGSGRDAGARDAAGPATGGAGGAPSAGAPNKGWIPWSGDYKLQNWTTKPDAEVFGAPGNGEYWTKLSNGDWAAGVKGRVEMRWPDWPDQNAENMIAADVMYEPGTDGTCIMQIKTNTGSAGHESIYLNVHDNGNLYHGVNKTVIVANGAGTWHNIKAAYDPRSGLARVWIDDVLKFQQSYAAGTGAVWYFKNGCYWASGTSKAHFKNVTFWRNPGGK